LAEKDGACAAPLPEAEARLAMEAAPDEGYTCCAAIICDEIRVFVGYASGSVSKDEA